VTLFFGILAFLVCCFVAVNMIGDGATFEEKLADLIFRAKTFFNSVNTKVKEKESTYYHRDDHNPFPGTHKEKDV